jgi:signal transduction histidine kinase
MTEQVHTPLRVLLVEDSEDDALILGQHLERGGYELDVLRVDTADTFKRALDQGGWDIVLSDYVLPGYNGLDALRAVQERKLDVPFIIVSGNIGEETAVEAMRAGADDYVMKSNLARLVPAVERELRDSRLRRLRTAEALRAEDALAERTLELERSNRELEEFANIASHDLSAPLRVTAGYLELFDHRHGDSVDEQGKLLLESAFRGTERMQRLIDDLLLYARASQDPLQLADVDTAALVRDVVEDFSTEIADKGAEVEVDPLPHIHSVYAPLSQVLHNLIGNSLKFTNGKTPQIQISACKLDRVWRFSVRDNGIGVEPRHVETTFRMFQRLHGAKYPGTGMGLALSKRVVERLGGELWHEPASKGGSIYHFTIPHKEAT